MRSNGYCEHLLGTLTLVWLIFLFHGSVQIYLGAVFLTVIEFSLLLCMETVSYLVGYVLGLKQRLL